LTTRLVAADFFTYEQPFKGRVDQDPAFTANYACNLTSNFIGVCDQQYDDLINNARVASNDDKRNDLYRQAQQIMVPVAGVVIFHYDALGRGLSAKVRGFTPVPDGIIRFMTVSLNS